MGYYEDLLNTVNKEINDGNFATALDLIEKELSMPYVPSDVEKKLKEHLGNIPKNSSIKKLSDEDIISYLKSDETKQLIAIDELNDRNLREYLDICEEYLTSNGYINAKVLLVHSLISQDINEEIKMLNEGIEYKFIPKYVMLPEESLGFKAALAILDEKYMKEPSKLELAKELLYKECLLALPLNYEEDEAKQLANKIYEYIENAFA